MAISSALEQHLQTKYVFIDTEAFRRAQYDWKGKALSRLVQFVNEGHLRLLITDITRREVISQLQEWLTEAATAVKKHEILLDQLEHGNVVATLSDSGAFAKLEDAFGEFLKACRTIDVPHDTAMDEIFSDYFARRPPFSNKKKAEFPDAVVIASLKAWCGKRNAKAYVVSGDPDLKACCSNSGPLLYAATIGEIISQATVSKELHDALQETLFQSETLSEVLAEQVRELPVERGDMRLRQLTGIVNSVDDINVHSVNVLEREGMTFTCEIEFEAGVGLRLEVEQEERFGYEPEAYEPPRVYSVERSIYRGFSAEVVMTFDPKKPDKPEFESVYVFKDSIKVDRDDLMAR